jgi:hypothetical protein
MKYQGGCHCGRIQFEVEGDIAQVMDCNCSMCVRRGGMLWFVPQAQFRLKTPEAALATYTFNKKNLQHHFCPTCGIAPFSEGKDRAGNAMRAINVRCLEGIDLKSLKIVPIDGRSL